MASVWHRGPCIDDAVASIAQAKLESRSDVIILVGGGRVLDTAKAAADELDLPFAAVPTSPATCAAVTPLSVMYTPEGRFLRSRATQRAPGFAVSDTGLLADAPDRLLVTGMIDALAKVPEVRRTSGDAGRVSRTARAILALCDDQAAIIDSHDDAAITCAAVGARTTGQGKCPHPRTHRRSGGRRRQVRRRPPLHNVLTALPGSHTTLDVEVFGLGTLVQMALAGGGEQVSAARRDGTHAWASAVT